MKKRQIIAGLLAIALPLGAQAASEASAKADYMNYCASCHGETGLGNGPRAESLQKAPTDLTQLTNKNKGHFPYQKVRRIIDGRPEKGYIRTHGIDMPIWGKEFMKEEIQGMAQIHAEAVMKMRILNIMDYLVVLQEIDILEQSQNKK